MLIIHDQHATPESLPAFAAQLLGWQFEPAQRLFLERAGGRVILNCARQWGKSTLAAVAVLHHALYTRDALVILAAPSLRQSAELLRKITALAQRLGLKPKSDGINRHSAVIQGSRIIAIPGTADTIRGFTRVTLLVIDEAAMVRDDLYDAVRPMLTQNQGSIWLLSTPNGQQGFYHREHVFGDEAWLRVLAPADQSPRFTPEQLAAERLALGESKFAQEFLCQFTAIDGALIDAQWLENLFVPGEPLHLEKES